MRKCHEIATPMEADFLGNDSENEVCNELYRELICSLLYLTGGTRPDIAFAVNVLSQFREAPIKRDWIALKKSFDI